MSAIVLQRGLNSLFRGLSLRPAVVGGVSCQNAITSPPTSSSSQLLTSVVHPPLPLVTSVRGVFFPRINGTRNDALIPDDVLERYHKFHELNLPRKPKKKCPIDHQPFMKGVVLKTLIKKPKKPNSANRKCVLLRLTNGKEATAYVPGVGHNLQEHSVVLVYKKRTKDVPGLKLRVVRGKYDCAHVIRKPQS